MAVRGEEDAPPVLPAPSVHHQDGVEFSSRGAPKKLSAEECRILVAKCWCKGAQVQ